MRSSDLYAEAAEIVSNPDRIKELRVEHVVSLVLLITKLRDENAQLRATVERLCPQSLVGAIRFVLNGSEANGADIAQWLGRPHLYLRRLGVLQVENPGQDVQFVKDGDWVLRHENGFVETMAHEDFLACSREL